MAKTDPKIVKKMSATHQKALKKGPGSPGYKAAMKAYNKRKSTPGMKPAKSANKPARAGGGAMAPGGGKKPGAKDEGLYGKGGEQGWLKRWNQAFIDRGMTPVDPATWAKQLGVVLPAHMKGYTGKYGGFEGSMPFDQYSTTPGWEGAGHISEAGQLMLLNAATGKNYASMAEAMADIGPEQAFAGLKQFQLNQAGDWGTVQGDPSLQNVTMQDPTMDPNAQRLILGNLMQAFNQGGPAAAQKLLADWETMAPDWAQTVADELRAGGTRFSTEFFGSPGVNVTDPNSPLFAGDVSPASMIGVTGLQRGEENIMRGMGAEDVARFLFPMIYGSAESAPIPTGQMMLGTEGGGALRQTPTYKAMTAYNLQGGVPEGGYQGIRHAGATYDPFTGGGEWAGVSPEAGMIARGELKPEYLAGSPSAFPDDLLLSWMNPVGAAAYGRPDLYWSGEQFAPYAPGTIDPAMYARFMAIANMLPPQVETMEV
jgi:hypothetical protein